MYDTKNIMHIDKIEMLRSNDKMLKSYKRKYKA